MEKNDDKNLIKVIIESYAVRDEDGREKFRLVTRERAEIELESLREYCEQHSLAFNYHITKERAIVECKVGRRRYPKNFPNPIKAGKTVYKLYHDDDLVKELDHEPKPMVLINACAYNVNWTIIE